MKKLLLSLVSVLLLITVLIGCGSKEKKSVVSLEVIHNAVKESLGEDYYPDMLLEEEMLEAIYGIDMDDVEDYIAESPMITMNVDTFIAIKAKDGKVDDVVEDLEEYRDFLINDGFMYPMNIAKVQASEVVSYGDYAFFIMLGAIDEDLDASDEKRLEFAKEEVSKVKTVIENLFN